MTIRPFVIYSFLFLLILGLLLPSDGNHGIFSPKSVAFLSASFFFIFFFGTRLSLRASLWKGALLFLGSLVFFGIWYVVGIDQNPQIKSGQFDQFKIFMTTLLTPLIGWFLVKDKLISYETVMRTIIYTNCAYNIVKTSLMVLHLLGVIHIWTVMHGTGLRYMSMHILGDIGRIQTSVDIVSPFLIYFVLQSDHLGIRLSKKFKWIFIFSASCSVFLSFSRFLIFTFFLSIVLHICTLGFFRQIKFWILSILFSAAAIGLIGPEQVLGVIEKRFFSSDNSASDATRKEQIDAMMRTCDAHPFLGTGLGGYTTECIRDFELPYAYEVQWVAFLMQFGLLGLFVILVPVSLITWNFLRPPLTRHKLSYLVLFGIWLFSGFTNPFLISLTSGIIYMIFLLTGDQYKYDLDFKKANL